METSMSHLRRPISQLRAGRSQGFTLVETLVAMFIMAVGMLGVAALMGQMSSTSVQSRYMSTEALLVSEKLEDLNRYNSSDPNLGGNANIGNVDLAINADPCCNDQIQVSAGSDGSGVVTDVGDIVEVSQGTDALGAYYITVTHNPNGSISTSDKTYAAAPAPTSDMATFNRRWLIEQNTPVAGVRRVTVLVTLANAVQGKQATFQMSMVRP